MEGSNSPHTLSVTMSPPQKPINCFLVMCMKLPPTLDEQGQVWATKCRYWLGGRPGVVVGFIFLFFCVQG